MRASWSIICLKFSSFLYVLQAISLATPSSLTFSNQIGDQICGDPTTSGTMSSTSSVKETVALISHQNYGYRSDPSCQIANWIMIEILAGLPAIVIWWDSENSWCFLLCPVILVVIKRSFCGLTILAMVTRWLQSYSLFGSQKVHVPVSVWFMSLAHSVGELILALAFRFRTKLAWRRECMLKRLCTGILWHFVSS